MIVSRHPALEEMVATLRTAQDNSRAEPPPGAAVLVDLFGDQYGAVSGSRQSERLTGVELPMTFGTSHDLASVTKIFGTTAALMRLVSDGQLRLDDQVTRYWSDFPAGVTVRHLLQHRSGLQAWWPIYLDADSRERAYDTILSLPLRDAPGRIGRYSDLGFMALGRIIEDVTTCRVDQAVSELVLEPLRLKNTLYARPAGDDVAASSTGDRFEKAMIDTGIPYPIPRQTATFHRWRERVLLGEINDGNAYHSFDGAAGHAGLFSTLGDLLIMANALARVDEQPLLWRPETRLEFFTPGPDPAQALGFRAYLLPGTDIRVLGHPGYTGLFFLFAPGGQFAAVVATNRLHVHGAPITSDYLVTTALTGLARLFDAQPTKDQK